MTVLLIHQWHEIPAVRQHRRRRDAAGHYGEFHAGIGDGQNKAPLERGRCAGGRYLHDAYYVYDLRHVLNSNRSLVGK